MGYLFLRQKRVKKMLKKNDIINKIKEAVISASSSYRSDKLQAYRKALDEENDQLSSWVIEKIIENEQIARTKRCPTCDDTGIPHILLELGDECQLNFSVIQYIYQGIVEGLRLLPGRPMGLLGNDIERIVQSAGISPEPDDVVPAPFFIKKAPGQSLRVHILLQGGGPEIRSKTYRIFHKNNLDLFVEEIISWATDEVRLLGCTPVIIALGVGRTHYEATTQMLQAMVYGDLSKQNDIETKITTAVNETKVGPLGIKGNTTALGTYLSIGPQRASGVRIVCMRLCCIVEPRLATVVIE